MVEPVRRRSDDIATLEPNLAKSRFGVAYVRAVCSQAGIGFDETSADEDVLAIDGHINFEVAPVRVQVKCTGRFRIKGGRSATWPIEEAWCRSWRQSKVPVYFVLVIVDPDDQDMWLHHHDEGTLHRAAAFWVRLDDLPCGHGIVVPKDQRLTAETFLRWAADVEDCFTSRDGCEVGG